MKKRAFPSKTMKNQSEKDFKTKFRLLNSQENSEEIIWTSSDSSDYEDVKPNEKFGKAIQIVNKKRKRGKTKSVNNISNLDITFQSPVVQKCKKVEGSSVLRKDFQSPILTRSQQYFEPLNIQEALSSPILTCRGNCSSNEITVKSPILQINHMSHKFSSNVRKKLFNNNNNIENIPTSKGTGRSTSPVLNCCQTIKKSKIDNSDYQNIYLKTVSKPHDTNIKQKVIDLDIIHQGSLPTKRFQAKNVIEIKPDVNDSKDMLNSKTVNVALFEKIKSYFDSHFSSETPSQQSISECESTSKNSSKTSEEIEIIKSQTDKKCILQMIKTESSSDSLKSYDFEIEKRKKVRYKKDGLAYRLNELLKKQKANICLWQHERFLAANCNFVLPKDDFTVFRIQNVNFKYGCYILQVIDVEERKYFVLINHLNMNNRVLEQCNIFKLYRPFKILEFNSEYQLIVNVIKFECAELDK